ncbi:MAG: 6-bladed beta-propeller, partial [Chitinophagaceae bacterium]
MNRKQFIRQTSIAATGIICSPSILHNLKNDEVILGHNNKRYRINTKWSQASASQYPVKDCHEMVQDKLGRIVLLTNETKNNVIIYDKSG